MCISHYLQMDVGLDKQAISKDFSVTQGQEKTRSSHRTSLDLEAESAEEIKESTVRLPTGPARWWTSSPIAGCTLSVVKADDRPRNGASGTNVTARGEPLKTPYSHLRSTTFRKQSEMSFVTKAVTKTLPKPRYSLFYKVPAPKKRDRLAVTVMGLVFLYFLQGSDLLPS